MPLKRELKDKIYYYPQFKDFNKDYLSKNIKKIVSLTEIKGLKFEIIEKQARKASKLRFSYTIDKESEGQDYRVHMVLDLKLYLGLRGMKHG